MLSKAGYEIPYFSPGPLGDNTKWVAFPVMISSRCKEYGPALAKGKDVATRILEICSALENDHCRVAQPPIEEKHRDLMTAVVFTKQRNECLAEIYNYVLVTFNASASLWEKMEIIARFLDSIAAFAGRFASDKGISIELGVRFTAGK